MAAFGSSSSSTGATPTLSGVKFGVCSDGRVVVPARPPKVIRVLGGLYGFRGRMLNRRTSRAYKKLCKSCVWRGNGKCLHPRGDGKLRRPPAVACDRWVWKTPEEPVETQVKAPNSIDRANRELLEGERVRQGGRGVGERSHPGGSAPDPKRKPRRY